MTNKNEIIKRKINSKPEEEEKLEDLKIERWMEYYKMLKI